MSHMQFYRKVVQFSDYIRFSSNKLPTLFQSEVSECGLTCLTMIACYYGFKTNMLSMRKKYPVGAHGLTVKQLIGIGNDIGLKSRVFKIGLSQIAKLKKPAILHWNFNHFVVLSKVTSKGITIHDPAKGKLKFSWSEVSDAFTGVSLELIPSSNAN